MGCLTISAEDCIIHMIISIHSCQCMLPMYAWSEVFTCLDMLLLQWEIWSVSFKPTILLNISDNIECPVYLCVQDPGEKTRTGSGSGSIGFQGHLLLFSFFYMSVSKFSHIWWQGILSHPSGLFSPLLFYYHKIEPPQSWDTFLSVLKSVCFIFVLLLWYPLTRVAYWFFLSLFFFLRESWICVSLCMEMSQP